MRGFYPEPSRYGFARQWRNFRCQNGVSEGVDIENQSSGSPIHDDLWHEVSSETAAADAHLLAICVEWKGQNTGY